MKNLERFTPYALSVLRIMAALLFMQHGLQKLLQFPTPSEAGTPGPWTVVWFGGWIEAAGGALLAAGLFTRAVAFVVAGEMAVAYWVVPGSLIQRLRCRQRDCLEHRNVVGATTTDFTLEADGKIDLPSVAIDFRGSVVERCSISEFMEGAVKTLLDSFEMITLHMCAKNIQPFSGMPMTIARLSDEQRQAWHARFAYGGYNANGLFLPCG